MNPDILKYVQDILDSISKIDFHLSTVSTVTQYSSNITIVDAVERRLSIIGEALWQGIYWFMIMILLTIQPFGEFVRIIFLF
jgi:uncharacterized protein with HEPN domain